MDDRSERASKRPKTFGSERHKFKRKDGTLIVKGTKKNVAPRDLSGPQLPLSPFMFFCKDWRERIQIANPGSIFSEQNKLLGSKWKELDEASKVKYRDQFHEDKLRYDLQMMQYKAKKGAEANELISSSPLTSPTAATSNTPYGPRR
ncbi:HMG-box [Clavulina sp. PMI_390]|nr:HMG-box [Clavulina sp. PMI_390]